MFRFQTSVPVSDVLNFVVVSSGLSRAAPRTPPRPLPSSSYCHHVHFHVQQYDTLTHCFNKSRIKKYPLRLWYLPAFHRMDRFWTRGKLKITKWLLFFGGGGWGRKRLYGRVSAWLYDCKKNPPSFYWYMSRNGKRYSSFLCVSALSVSSPYFLNHVDPSAIPSKAPRSIIVNFRRLSVPEAVLVIYEFLPSLVFLRHCYSLRLLVSVSVHLRLWLAAVGLWHLSLLVVTRYLRRSLPSYSLSADRTVKEQCHCPTSDKWRVAWSMNRSGSWHNKHKKSFL
jgi:hypothetical protein